MIRLEIIDPATGNILTPHLSASLSFEMLRENPLFSSRGDYTYDIDISLRSPHNRAIYQHIDRITSADRPQGRRARLIADGRVIADGTEVVLRMEAENVKIQIVAGNSELNYITADKNLRLREMDFGEVSAEDNTADVATANANKIFPEVNHTYPTCYKETNENGVAILINDAIATTSTLPDYIFTASFYPQPFLLFILERFLQLLGYTVGTNCLRNEPRWCRLIICSGYPTLKYAKMLPDWTAAEFIDEIEKFFGIIFVVNPVNRVVDIVNLSAMQTETANEIDDSIVLDQFDRTYDETADLLTNRVNVAYDLPTDTPYWRYASVPDDIARRCETVEVNTASAIPRGLQDWTIFKVLDTEEECVRIDNLSTRLVNRFAGVINDESVSVSTMKIRPVQTQDITLYTEHADSGGTGRGGVLSGQVLIPVPRFYEIQDDQTMYGAMTEGLKQDEAGNAMEVAFYLGNCKVMGDTKRFPWCLTDNGNATTHYVGNADVPGADKMTLVLRYSYGRYAQDFSAATRIDTNEKHVIRIKSAVKYNLLVPFLIHGRLFICQQLKYTYADGRQHPIVEGTFYPYI